MNINYAIKITTGQTSLNDSAIGLVSGVLQWITGIPAIAGWKEGVLTWRSLSPVSQEIEITAGGSYATMSGFSLAINSHLGGTSMRKRLYDLGLNLIQKEIVFYTVRDGVFTQDWTGAIESATEDENEFRIEAMDKFRSIHKPLLKRLFDSATFSNLPDSIAGKPIPLCLGFGARSLLYPVLQREVYETVCTNSSVNYDVAPFTAYTSSGTGAYKVWTLTLKTGSLSVASNAWAGKYITAIKGGSETVKIRSNSASAAGTTDIVLDQPFSGTPISWSGSGVDVWYFQISSLSIRYILSASPIYEFTLNSESRQTLSTFDDTLKEFDDISEIGYTFSTTSIDSLGFPGCTLLSKPINTSGTAYYYKYKPLTSITELAETKASVGAITGTRPTPNAGTNLTGLTDQSNTPAYTWIATTTAGNEGYITIPFKVPIDPTWVSSNFTNIYFAWNHRIEFDTTAYFTVFLNVKLIDFLGRTTNALDTTDRIIYSGNPGGAWDSSDSLIPSNYGLGFTTSILGNVISLLGLNKGSANIAKAVDAETYPYAVFELRIDWQQLIGTSTLTLTMKEATTIGEKSLNLLTSSLYAKNKGALFGSTWSSRRTAANPVLNIGDAVEYLIRVQDSGGSYINSTAFDTVSDPSTGYRKDWYIGRQITEQANSFDLCDELARFGFFGIIPKADGTRGLKAWMDLGAPAITHDEGVIIKGTLQRRERTSLANLYNDIQVNYAWNPGTQKFDKFYRITNIDQASFPLITDATWRTYAVGFTDAEYSTAATLWGQCHTSWQRYGVIQKLPDDMANAYWFPDIVGDWGLTDTNNSALLYLTELCSWTPYQKDVISYRLPNTSTHSGLELLDRIAFSDQFYTGGTTENGWIVKKSILPGTGHADGDEIEITLMLGTGLP